MVNNGYTLDLIGMIKQYYDMDGEEAVLELPGLCLDEECEGWFYEALYESVFLISSRYNEEMGCSKYFFSSDEMNEYYRLANKIGRLNGWSNKENVYINRAEKYTLQRLNKLETNGDCYGQVHTGTKHKYASSVTVYVAEEYFYNYMELYFSLNAVFRYYENQVKKLRKVYISMLATQNMEVAA